MIKLKIQYKKMDQQQQQQQQTPIHLPEVSDKSSLKGDSSDEELCTMHNAPQQDVQPIGDHVKKIAKSIKGANESTHARQTNGIYGGTATHTSNGVEGAENEIATFQSLEEGEEEKKPIEEEPLNNQQQIHFSVNQAKFPEDLLKPLPIIPKGSAYQEGLEVPKWRQKKNILLNSLKQQDKKGNKNGQNEVEGEEEKKEIDDLEVVPGDPDQKVKTVQQVQDKLNKYAEQFPLQQFVQVDKERFPKYFKYLIYECYKPKNLLETKKLMQLFLYQTKTSEPPPLNNEYYSDYLSYLKKESVTKFPSYINERNLLVFDSNFEGGNLDSAYVVNENEYNLLMKVDTNTKGSSFWFYFKVRGVWKSKEKEDGRIVKFNIINFGKSDIKNFYQNGMNVMTRICKDGEPDSLPVNSRNGSQAKWETNQCHDIEFSQNLEVEKINQTGGGNNRFFFQLSFKYKFQPLSTSSQSQINGLGAEDGPTVCFAYCLPFSYTDLLADLKYIKFALLDGEVTQEATITYFAGKHAHVQAKHSSDDIAFIGQLNPNNGAVEPTTILQHQNTEQSLTQDINNLLEGGFSKQGVSNTLNGQNSIGQPERQRLTQYELQHIEIRNRGLKVIKLNQIEKALMSDPNNTQENNENIMHLVTSPKNPQYIQTTGFSGSIDSVIGEEFEIRTSQFLYRQEIICRSVGGLPIYQLTISNNSGINVSNNNYQTSNKPQRKKKIIYITSRVHAGETHASIVMSKLLYELCLSFKTEKNKYDSLLQNYIIKLVPMINADGVVIGNSRTSLVGLDLNRRWTQPNPLIHPEVFFLKKEMLKAHKTSEGIQIFCDLHGHNKNPNAFVYGCHKAANQGLLSWTKTRLLPKIIATLTPIFNFKDCQFKIDNCKLNTARVVCWNELKITNSFTLEISMYGKLLNSKDLTNTGGSLPSNNPLSPRNNIENVGEQKNLQQNNGRQIIQFSASDFRQIAISLLQSLIQYNTMEPQLEQEFQQTGGWLKVSKLNNMTGKAARDRIEENYRSNQKRSSNKGFQRQSSNAVSNSNATNQYSKKVSSINVRTSQGGFQSNGQNVTEQQQKKDQTSKVQASAQATPKAQQEQTKPQESIQTQSQQIQQKPEQTNPRQSAQSNRVNPQESDANSTNGNSNSGSQILPPSSQNIRKSIADIQLPSSNGSIIINQPVRQQIKNKAKTQGLQYDSNIQKPQVLKSKVSGTSLDSTSNTSGIANWRDFFDQKELEKIMIPEEENEDEEEGSENGKEDGSEKGGSDSDPSEDNIDAGEFLEMIQTAFKDDEDVSFKELKTITSPIEVPKPKAQSVKQQTIEVKPAPPPQPLNNHRLQQLQQGTPPRQRTFNEEDEGYNFIVKTQPQQLYQQHNFIMSSPQQLYKAHSPAMMGNCANHHPLEVQSVNYRQSQINKIKQIEEYRRTHNGEYPPEMMFSKSPIMIKPSQTQYSAWSQNKIKQTQHEKLKSLQKITNIRGTNIQQASHQRYPNTGNVISSSSSQINSAHQDLSESKRVNKSVNGNNSLHPYLSKIVADSHNKSTSHNTSQITQNSNSKPAYFSSGPELDHSFETYMQMLKPGMSNHPLIQNTAQNINDSYSYPLRISKEQPQPLSAGLYFMQYPQFNGQNINQNNQKLLLGQQAIINSTVANALRQSFISNGLTDKSIGVGKNNMTGHSTTQVSGEKQSSQNLNEQTKPIQHILMPKNYPSNINQQLKSHRSHAQDDAIESHRVNHYASKTHEKQSNGLLGDEREVMKEEGENQLDDKSDEDEVEGLEAAAKRDAVQNCFYGVTPEKGLRQGSQMSAQVSPTAARATVLNDKKIDQWKQHAASIRDSSQSIQRLNKGQLVAAHIITNGAQRRLILPSSASKDNSQLPAIVSSQTNISKISNEETGRTQSQLLNRRNEYTTSGPGFNDDMENYQKNPFQKDPSFLINRQTSEIVSGASHPIQISQIGSNNNAIFSVKDKVQASATASLNSSFTDLLSRQKTVKVSGGNAPQVSNGANMSTTLGGSSTQQNQTVITAQRLSLASNNQQQQILRLLPNNNADITRYASQSQNRPSQQQQAIHSAQIQASIMQRTFHNESSGVGAASTKTSDEIYASKQLHNMTATTGLFNQKAGSQQPTRRIVVNTKGLGGPAHQQSGIIIVMGQSSSNNAAKNTVNIKQSTNGNSQTIQHAEIIGKEGKQQKLATTIFNSRTQTRE